MMTQKVEYLLQNQRLLANSQRTMQWYGLLTDAEVKEIRDRGIYVNIIRHSNVFDFDAMGNRVEMKCYNFSW